MRDVADVCGTTRAPPWAIASRPFGAEDRRSRRPLAVEVLDGRLVAPGDLVARQAEDGGDAVAVLGAGRPAAQDDGDDALLVHAGQLGQLPGVEAALGAQLVH